MTKTMGLAFVSLCMVLGVGVGLARDAGTVNALVGVEQAKSASSICAIDCGDARECDVPVGCIGIVGVPLTACDDAVDCARAIDDICGRIGQGKADTVDFDRRAGKCEGSCDGDGRHVEVECVSG